MLFFMDDTPSEVKRKVNQSFCEEKNIAVNPGLEYCKHILFEKFPDGVSVEREAIHGGNVTFKTYEEMEKSFAAGALHPGDLKTTLIKYLNELLAPVQEHFKKNPEAKKLRDEVAKFTITK